MQFGYSPWPHLDVASLPQPLKKFLLFTVGFSLYAGVTIMVAFIAIATSDAVFALLDSGLTDFTAFIAELGHLYLNVTVPA